MARQGKGILDGPHGSLSNVTGYRSKEKSIIKTKNSNIKNPKTPNQILYRTKLKNIVELSTMILDGYIKPLWDPFYKKKSGYNAFISSNINLFEPTGLNPAENFTLSKGIIGAVSANIINTLLNPKTISVEWPTTIPKNGYFEDALYMMAYNETKKEFGVLINPGFPIRDDGDTNITFPNNVEPGDFIHIYVSFKNPYFNMVSNTGHSSFILT